MPNCEALCILNVDMSESRLKGAALLRAQRLKLASISITPADPAQVCPLVQIRFHVLQAVPGLSSHEDTQYTKNRCYYNFCFYNFYVRDNLHPCCFQLLIPKCTSDDHLTVLLGHGREDLAVK